MAKIEALIEVFEEAKKLLQLEGNDFSWSGWENAEEAVGEVDMILKEIQDGKPPGPYANVLFLPTGPLQETSLSSGWGDEFVALADRFDQAMEAEER